MASLQVCLTWEKLGLSKVSDVKTDCASMQMDNLVNPEKVQEGVCKNQGGVVRSWQTKIY